MTFKGPFQPKLFYDSTIPMDGARGRGQCLVMLVDLARAGPTTGDGWVSFPLIPKAVRYQHKYSDTNLHPHGGEARIVVKKALRHW